LCFQAPCLLPWLTARQNIQIAASQGLVSRSRREAATAPTSISTWWAFATRPISFRHNSRSARSSGVSLARALSVEPRFLLLDEPFSQLDSLTRFELQDLLLRVWERSGKTVVMVTHDIDEALYLADRLILMTDGPEATVWRDLKVPFPRPRARSSVLNHPEYQACRRRVIDFLDHHAQQSRSSCAGYCVAREGASELTLAGARRLRGRCEQARSWSAIARCPA
jgi:ABC-type nitrate/sulfonate/bicarbonate transport system ATPase subunit